MLKKTIDWASRQENGKPGPLNEKPLAIMGVGGRAGTARAQNHLRQIASHLNMVAINKPEVLVSTYNKQLFDENGQLIDSLTIHQIGQLLENLVTFSKKFNSESLVNFNLN